MTDEIKIPDILNLPKQGAESLLSMSGFTMRITSEDGEHYIGDCAYHFDRVNVTVVEGIVSEINGVG